MTSRADRFAALLASNPTTSTRHAPKQAEKVFCQTAEAGMKFSPILGVAKFPYKYMSRSHSEAVSLHFFAGGKFWDRQWDLYYVWSPHFDSGKPVLFVPLDQTLGLIKDINGAFPSYMVGMPADSEQNGLICSFTEDHTQLRPRFLGRSTSKADYERLQLLAPHFGPDSTNKPSSESVEIFQDEMSAAMDAAKNRNKAAKTKKQEDRLLKQQDMKRQFERAQSFLGLRPPFEPEGDVIFVAVDVESWERNHSIITEIGIATLDTRDLHNKPPGVNGKNWHKSIRARHFRIKEYAHYVNRDFVHGCPDKFEFGISEFIDLKDAPRVVANCFKPPYSDPKVDTQETELEKRSIVFLGHDAKQDIAYLRDLGYDPTNLSNLVEFQDTAVMYRACSGSNNARALAHILYELDFESWNTHNAGNDAVYTMQAMLGLCVKHASNKAEPEVETKPSQSEDDEGGVSLLPAKNESGKPRLESGASDWEVVETTAKLSEWEM